MTVSSMMMILTACLAAGTLQSVTGFGAGIVIMMVLPLWFDLPVAAGISTAICMTLSLSMVWTYRKHVRLKKVLLPAVLYMTICSLVISFSRNLNQELMKMVFGAFLMALSIYYLFFSKKEVSGRLSLPVSLACIAFSAVSDGLFGIGGPLMVLYYMSSTKSRDEYLGCIQAFFALNTMWNTILRVSTGILTASQLPVILMGIAAITLGGLFGKKIADRMDGDKVRKLTYLMIGVSGLLNII